MYTVLIVLAVIASILMCFIVLIQESKGGGLASGFSSSNQIMGVRKTTDIIEKATWTLAIVLVVLSVASSYLVPTAATETSVMMNSNIPAQTAAPAVPQQNTTTAPATTPAQGTPAPVSGN
ncbi:MAG: preprotein translocase subunit SecG [Bacteroidaceae bacterium]